MYLLRTSSQNLHVNFSLLRAAHVYKNIVFQAGHYLCYLQLLVSYWNMYAYLNIMSINTTTTTYIGLCTGSYLVVKVSLYEAVITNCYNCVLMVLVLATSMIGTGRVDFH